jgi:hypothetical protein
MPIRSFLLIILFFIASVTQAQVVDVAPTGKSGYLPVEGGSVKMNIDIQTPTETLIKKFEQPWQFNETGKMYWIGYTNNMYSIAARKNDAIKPLIDFIETSHDEHAKLGAVYTLHLIGINSSVAGRYYEEFRNKEARKALIYVLKYDDLTETSLTLLMRDPWLSDVPHLIALMEHKTSDCWTVTNALLHYNINHIPLDKDLPESIGNLEIPFARPSQSAINKTYCESEVQKALHIIIKLKNPHIKIENDLYKGDLLGDSYSAITAGMMENDMTGKTLFDNKDHTTISRLLGLITNVDYVHLGNKLYYYSTDGNLYICTSTTAKTRLLNWWHTQTPAQMQHFSMDNTAPIH